MFNLRFKDFLTRPVVSLQKPDIGCISINENNFWDVSRILLEKIEGPSYLQNKEKQNDYLSKHPYVAKKLNINIVSVEKKG